MTLAETHRIEHTKWDARARLVRSDECMRVRDADFGAYARRVGTMPGVAEFIGDLQGRDVLEYGCGLGQLTTLLALSGARVTAFDLSPASIEVARRRAAQHGVLDRIDLVVAAGEDLPFVDERFEVVVGKAVLHHLDAARAAPELHRVLCPGGRAAFSEPLGTNSLVTFARRRLPYPRKNPRGADVQLTRADPKQWGAPFREIHRREVQLLSMLERALGLGAVPALRSTDIWLLERVPALRSLCRSVVLTMVK